MQRRAGEGQRAAPLLLSAQSDWEVAWTGSKAEKIVTWDAAVRHPEIPSGVVVWEGDTIAAVIEGEPRIEGHFHARLDVHVTGKSTIAHRQIG